MSLLATATVRPPFQVFPVHSKTSGVPGTRPKGWGVQVVGGYHWTLIYVSGEPWV